ncbi:MAG: ABC transporter substrate-binding protein [Desulfobacterota bacterium]|nr:ABC transporter substrate-binding protein [Thermodesulfobacteriota bacterium]
MAHFLSALLLISSLSLIPFTSFAATIAVITRDDILPYRDFTERYQKAGKKSGHAIKIFSLGKDTSADITVRNLIRACAPSVLVSVGKSAAVFAAEQFAGHPRVCAMMPSPRDVADMVRSGALVVSMEIRAEKKLDILRAIMPQATKIGTVYDPAESGEAVRDLEIVAKQEGLSLRALAIASAKEAPEAVQAIIESSIDAFILLYDRTVLSPQTFDVLFAASFSHRVPVIGFSEKYVAMGALISLEAPVHELAYAAWDATERCITEPAACKGMIRLDTPGKIIINSTIAEKLGFSIPEALKKTATEVK